MPAPAQRAALQLVAAELFSSASFKFEPALMSRLGVDHFERSASGSGVDYSLPTAVLTLQRPALDTLMSDSLAARLADAESKVTDPRSLVSFAEVQQRLSDAVWSELAPAKTNAGGEIDSLRRNLQREHLRRLASALVRPGAAAAADVRPVMRQAALQLQARLKLALDGPAGRTRSALVRAHLEDSLATLSDALKAPLAKQGV
ncbi:MAG: zinc-dependent metalloprotease [Chitinophagaceae bacterium]|nr:zinc-dependent metalloprotease [Rubrivivax sp.]